MQPLGKNVNRYCGDTIDIRRVLREIEAAANQHGWRVETFFDTGNFKLLTLHRDAQSTPGVGFTPRVYLSSGIHGDEPAGPTAVLRLLQENRWPENLDLTLCPCLNPIGFELNCRGNEKGVDLNREYLKPTTGEILAHVAWLEQQRNFDLCLMLHEDWESKGFYLYEQNPEKQTSLAEPMIEQVGKVCPVDRSELIEGRPAREGIIRPNININERLDWPEAFYMITHKTRLSYTLEAPSDFAMSTRVDGLVAAVNAAVDLISRR